MPVHRLFQLLGPVAMLMQGCAVDDEARMRSEIQALLASAESQPINLATVGPNDWERVCVLEPYMNNDEALKVLGVAWDAEQHTPIASSDAIYVLAFVADGQVIGHAEMLRQQGDLLSLQPPCVDRADAMLMRQNDGTWVTVPVSE